MLALYAADLLPMGRFVRLAAIGGIVAAVFLAPSYPIQLTGSLLLIAAAGLFVVDFWSKINYVAASLAIVLLPIGFLLFYSSPERINTQLALWLGFMLSSATATYCWRAKRARLNKLADL